MICYKITNKITGKIYIGITTKTAELRFDSHIYSARSNKNSRRPLLVALRQYPFDSWQIEIIGTAPTWEDLCELERSMIYEYRSTNPSIGYNVAFGGEGLIGYVRTKEVSERVAAKLRGRTHSAESRARISAANKGIAKSPEHVAKSVAVRLAMNSKKTPEQKEKSARFHRGRKRLPETGRRISEARKRYFLLNPRRPPSPKRDHDRDAAIMAHYHGSRNMRITGIEFGVTAGAIHFALERCRRDYEERLQAGSRLYAGFKSPKIIPPDFLGYAYRGFR